MMYTLRVCDTGTQGIKGVILIAREISQAGQALWISLVRQYVVCSTSIE